jgi:ABC-2 type transport system ATP-binding protein
VIGKGHLITQGSVGDLTAAAKGSVVVRGNDLERLEQALRAAGATVEAANDDTLRVGAMTAEAVGQVAFDHGVVLFELTPERASLEEVYMALTAGAVEYGSGAS